MTHAQILLLIRTAHTIIYCIMAASVVGILLSALVGYVGPWLIVALILVGIESVVFVASGLRCPLTDLARRYGAEKGYAFDTFLPEALAKHTFRFFGALLVLGLVGLTLRALLP